MKKLKYLFVALTLACTTGQQDSDMTLDFSDQDSDGFTDTDEEFAGTDPKDCSSVPEGWPDCFYQAKVDKIYGTGWNPGETIPNFSAVDQFGNSFQFYQLYKKKIILDMSAAWCGPCNMAASNAEAEYQEYKDENIIFVHLMIDDGTKDGKITEENFLANWAEFYGLTFPVLSDHSGPQGYPEAYYEFYMAGEINGIPAFVSIDENMVIQNTWSGYGGQGMSNALQQLINK